MVEKVISPDSGDDKSQGDGKVDELLEKARLEGVQVTDNRGDNRGQSDTGEAIERVLDQLSGAQP